MARDYSFTQNRELSWLKFDKRVLEEARDERVPLLERLKFISIFVSNLDEFYMVRCGTLHDIALIDVDYIDNKSGLSAKEQLDAIFNKTPELYRLKDEIYDEVFEKLGKYNIKELDFKDLDEQEREFIDSYFRNQIYPILSPQIIDFQHPFPHFRNNALNIVLSIKKEKEHSFGFITVPGSLDRVIFLPGEDIRYILIENVILAYVEEIFANFKVTTKTIMSVTRNADISFLHEQLEDDLGYRDLVKKILKKRSRLAPIRLQFYKSESDDLVNFLTLKLGIQKNQVMLSKSPLDMSYVFSLIDHIEDSKPGLYEKLSYKPFTPLHPPDLKDGSMISQILRRDFLFYYPFESMDMFLRLLKEAANDDKVVSIKITIYRLAQHSKIAQYLLEAVDNGIEVTALIELRARFDEQNNIRYAEILEEAGCNVIYGFEDYKVHSKICLITRRSRNGFDNITQLGTGNYNEKTSKLYTDFSYLTSRRDIGEDAVAFFQNMSLGNLDGNYKKLIVSPTSFKSNITDKIHDQIMEAEKGNPACIIMKMNSLTDRDLINLLKKASRAGVKINLIIRGICCIIPGISDVTENIRVISIVGRLLEHSRIYSFGCGDEREIYLSSADLMTRNTEKRVEIGFPIEDKSLKNRIAKMLDVMLNDNVKAREVDTNGDLVEIPIDGEEISSQDIFFKNLFYQQSNEKDNPSFISKLKHLFE